MSRTTLKSWESPMTKNAHIDTELYEWRSDLTQPSSTDALGQRYFHEEKSWRREWKIERKYRTDYVYTNNTFEGQESKVVTIDPGRNGQDGEIDESGSSTMTSPDPGASNSEFVAEKNKSNSKGKPYVRLNHNTDVNTISYGLFIVWGMAEPDVIFSVVSDSEYSTAKGNEVIEEMSNGSVQNICRSLVTAAASTNAWIITGGLNKGIDDFFGSEVKQKLANLDKIPNALLGISNWDSLAEKKDDLLKDSVGSISNPSELSLNPDHTHFLLVNDGTQMNPCSGCSIREKVELALMKREENVTENNQYRPLIYILIGGSVNAFGVVERALAHRIPVIVVTGTGGAADIICEAATSKDGATLDYLPEIFEKPFNQLEELLINKCTSPDEVRKGIANIKAEMKLKPFLEVIELLLDKAMLFDEVVQQLRNDIVTLKIRSTNELLAKIKDLLIIKQKGLFVSPYCPTANAEFEIVNRLRALFVQMLVVTGVTLEIAKRAVDDIEPDLLNEMLTKIKFVCGCLKTFETHNQMGLLIKFDINSRQKESITNVIIETLNEQRCTEPGDVFMLAADWDKEQFFKQLLLEKWKSQEHQPVLVELLNKGNNKYAKLILEHNCDSRWLMKLEDGPLVNNILSGVVTNLKNETFTKRNSYGDWFSKIINNAESKADNRIVGKVLFLWCTWNKMPDTAMLFWERGQDCLAMALVGYELSRKQKKKLVNKKGYEQMKNQIKIFSKLTLNFVRKCYEEDSKRTHDLLIGKVKDLDNRTPLQIAVDSNFRAFVSEAATQDLLNDIWFKNIKNHHHYKYTSMILSEACPFLAPKLLKIPDDSLECNNEKEDSTATDRCASVRKYFSKVKRFIDSPIVKFSYAFISFLAYLTLFSIVLLTDFRPKITPTEVALIIWTFILLIEEVRQVIVDEFEYKGNKWNYFDILTFTLYVVGFILRTIYHVDPSICPHCLYHARIVLAFSLTIFFLRTLQFLSVYETLGPKIFMMYKLVADLASFLVILTVFISAYGVVSNVILYPNQPLNAELLKDVFYDAWWSILGEFNREDALGSDCNKEDPDPSIAANYCSSTTDDNITYEECKKQKCPANSWIVPVLLAIYSLITCVMLLNVLIAIFNSTFEDINKEQTEVWRMQRYGLIREFNSRSMVPPPLCVVTYPYFIIQELRRRCKTSRPQTSHTSTTDMENKEYSLNEDKSEDVLKDVKKSRQSKSSLNAFEKDLTPTVKYWEHQVVAEYYKGNKEKIGRYVARLKSETEENDDFDEKPYNCTCKSYADLCYPADS